MGLVRSVASVNGMGQLFARKYSAPKVAPGADRMSTDVVGRTEEKIKEKAGTCDRLLGYYTYLGQLYGGGGGNRTRVRKSLYRQFYILSTAI